MISEAFKASGEKGGVQTPPFVVYLITCLPTGKQYIGITVQKLNRRWVHHVSSAKRLYRKGPLQHAIHEYGRNAFSIEVIEVCNSQSELVEREQFWMAHYNTLAPNGLNKATFSGHPMGWKHTDEAKAKIAASKIGKKPSEETKVRLSAWQKGRKLSAEHKAKIAEAGKGKAHSEESKEKVRRAKLKWHEERRARGEPWNPSAK